MFATTLCRSIPFLLLTLGTLPAQRLPDDRAKGAAAVDEQRCRQWLGTLASPEFEGRGTGQPGFQRAADFVAEQFRAIGLEARGDDGSYFQHMPWADAKVVGARTFVEFTDAEGGALRVPADRLAGSAGASASARGEVVLLVIEPPAEAPAERTTAPPIPGLAELDVAGKVVVAFVRQQGARRAMAATRFAVLQGLQGKDAAAVLFAQQDDVRGGLRGRQAARRRTNPAAAAARLAPLDLAFGGDDLTAMLRHAGQEPGLLDGEALATPLPLEASIEVAVEETGAPAMNVWGVLPGADPELAGEYVVIGSHLDHLGKRGGTIHPGADDDGSGTTGVLAVAAMFAENPVRPRRSVLFVCFAGEENGLLGSAWFVDHCPIPLSSIAAELQMDMIGRDEEEASDGGRLVNQGETAEQNRNTLHLVGSQKLAPQLHETCLAANERAGFELEYDQESMFTRSDHANFARQGVPVAFFFTGLHRDYHRPSDTPDKIRYGKLLRVARYVYDIAFTLASASDRPEIDAELWSAFRGKRSSEPAAPVRGVRAGARRPAGAAPEADPGSR